MHIWLLIIIDSVQLGNQIYESATVAVEFATGDIWVAANTLVYQFAESGELIGTYSTDMWEGDFYFVNAFALHQASRTLCI